MSLMARDYIPEMHDPERQQNRGNSTFAPPKHLLERENSVSSLLKDVSERAKKMNPFSTSTNSAHEIDSGTHEPVNIMDTSLARYSHSESAPMGEGQLIGAHARKTHSMNAHNGGANLGAMDGDANDMEDIWLDTSGGGGKQFLDLSQPNSSLKRRQKLLFWGLLIGFLVLPTSVLIHRYRGSRGKTEVEANGLELTPAPEVVVPEEEVEVTAPENEDDKDEEDETVTVTTMNIEEAHKELDAELADIESEEQYIENEKGLAENGAQTDTLEDEEGALQDEEDVILEQEEILQDMEAAGTQKEEALLEEEFGNLDEQVENLGDVSTILDKEAQTGETEVEQLENELDDLEDIESVLEAQQQAIDTEEENEYEKDAAAGEDGQ